MMRRMMAGGVFFLGLGVTLLAAEPPVKPAAPTHAGFEKMKSLAGTWVEADRDGKPTDKVVSIIKVTAGGSAVTDTIFPDQPQEMVSVYTVEGSDLIMTHYCVLGNQPRMKANPKSPKDSIQFEFTGGTNLNPAKDMHMHAATLKFVDADHIEMGGVAWVDGKPSEEHCGTQKLIRKK